LSGTGATITDRALCRFVERLALESAGSKARNHYAEGCEGSEMRRANLLLYLREMADRQPRVMLVGEAPGYKGCRLTGVPFTSEEVIKRGVRCGLFGADKGYRVAGESREQTASITWDTLGQLGLTPLMWNAYPFHPFAEGDERSNRAPTGAEMRAVSHFLLELLYLFQVEMVIAVGNRAEYALRAAGIKGEKVRHPSHGGKAAFAAGLERLPQLGWNATR
jgi:uracil-DNA glycosylase